MADADDLLRDGDTAGARAALVDIVRSRPADQQARMFLFQLFAVVGEWDKARIQLEALAQLSPEAQMLAVTYNQALEAERLREAVFAGSQPAVLLAGAGGWAEGIATSIGHLARGDVAAATEARDAAFDAAPDMPGRIDGQRFDWIADADSRFGPVCEAIVGGRYGLIPFDQIARLKSDGPRDLRDIVWYPVQISFVSGQSAAGFLPARYPGSHRAADTAQQLARATGWDDQPWGQQGQGCRLWSLSDGEDRSLLDVRSLQFG